MLSIPSFANIVLAVAVLVWAVSRQFMTAPVGALRLRTFAILGVIGLWQVASLADAGGVSVVDAAALVASLAGAAGFGWLRGRVARVWAYDGVAYRRGGWPTVALWAAGLAVHGGIDVVAAAAQRAHGLGQIGSASIMLYLAVTLGIQALIVGRRAEAALEAAAAASPIVVPRTRPLAGF
jgi:hypothetical protein